LSALAKRLAGLRQQAGAASGSVAAPVAPRDATNDGRAVPSVGLRGTTPDAQVAPSVAHGAKTVEAQVAQLRKLLGLRPRALAPARSFDRSLEGDEIAPGLRYIEKWVPFERLPERLELAALNLTASKPGASSPSTPRPRALPAVPAPAPS
jgi:hypothetical protein